MVRAEGQEGATFEYIDAFMDSLDEMVHGGGARAPDVRLSVTSPGFAAASVASTPASSGSCLKDPEERERSQQEIADGPQPQGCAASPTPASS